MVATNLGSPLLKLQKTFSEKNRVEMHGIIDDCIQRCVRHTLPLKVAMVKSTYEKHHLMHYHFNPEIFVQLQGVTEFTFPKENLVVKPGEVCIVPSGVPHKERVYPENGQFRNLVIAFYQNSICCHFAYEASPGRPDIEVIEFFEAPNTHHVEQLANILIHTYHTSTPARETAMRGLTSAFFSIVRNVVDSGNEEFHSDTGKIFQVKWLVREQISNPDLSVKTIAEKLQCSADYLSHLFHQQTGEKLIQYIQRKRIESAKLALEATPLYVSEVAWSSGFSDPAYFARVFRKFTGESPHAFRERLEKLRNEHDPRPKTIYHDRVDFSIGKPPSPGADALAS